MTMFLDHVFERTLGRAPDSSFGAGDFAGFREGGAGPARASCKDAVSEPALRPVRGTGRQERTAEAGRPPNNEVVVIS